MSKLAIQLLRIVMSAILQLKIVTKKKKKMNLKNNLAISKASNTKADVKLKLKSRLRKN